MLNAYSSPVSSEKFFKLMALKILKSNMDSKARLRKKTCQTKIPLKNSGYTPD